MIRIHIYHCYAHSTDDFVVVEVDARLLPEECVAEAIRQAAKMTQWPAHRIIARYQLTVINPDADGRCAIRAHRREAVADAS